MTESTTPLSEILNEAQAGTPESVPEVAPEEQPEGQPRGEDGKFVAKQETGVEDEAPPANQLPQEEYKAIREEREKRQKLEAELEAIKQQLQQKPQEPPPPPPSMWEDEQAWQQHFGSQVVQQAALNAKLDLSEMLCRRDNADFDDMKARFLEMAQQNPALRDEALADPDPWGKAYRIAKNAATMAELGATDVSELEAKLREKIMAELQTEPVQQQLSAPPTITGERNVGTRSGPAWAGPTPLSKLLGS